MVSQKKEDISYSDKECKHGKPAEVFRFHLFLKHIIQSKEEQYPLAVMRWPENGSFLLGQIKNWIANKSSGFNALKIISSLRQEPIYRSPGGGQQMAVTRYSISIHIEDRDAFYQGASKSQMLLWDSHAPPPKRVPSDGDSYIVSMEVFVDKIDLGGLGLDNRNPEVHVKVTLHVANARRAWTPPAFNPCVNYHADYTLSPKEFCQLVGPQKYFLPTEMQKDPIPTLNPCFLNHHADYTLSPEDFCQLVGPQKFFLHSEQPKDPKPKDGILDPGPPKLNHAIHVDRQNLNLSGWSYCKSGDAALSRLKTGCILMLLASTVAATPVPQSNQVEMQFQGANNLNASNCILKINMCSECNDHCGQTEKCNATVLNLVGDLYERLQTFMDTNQQSLQKRYNSSGTLQVNLIWELNKDFNVTNVTIKYTFNGKELPEEEITKLPMLISDPEKNDSSLNSSMLMEKEKEYVKKWGSFREKLLPILKKCDLPGTTEPWVIAVSTVFSVIIILIAIFIVLSIKYGMKSCKTVKETIRKAAYGLVSQTEAQGSPNWMEAPEREDMTSSV